jgi:RNA polymerase sigma factor (sigma-70 family)
VPHLQNNQSMEDKNWGLTEAGFQQLIAHLDKGDERQFQRIFTKNFAKYRNYIKSDMNISYDDASDAVTEAFVKMHRFLVERRVEYGNLMSYTLRIAKNEYLMLLRKRKQLPETDADFDKLDIIDEEYDDSTMEQFEKAFGLLGTDCRDLLKLHYYEKKAHREIGQTLNISEDASKTRMKVCRNKLRDVFLQFLKAAA